MIRCLKYGKRKNSAIYRVVCQLRTQWKPAKVRLQICLISGSFYDISEDTGCFKDIKNAPFYKLGETFIIPLKILKIGLVEVLF